MAKGRRRWTPGPVAALLLTVVMLFSPFILAEVLLPYWRNSGGFDGPAGVPAVALIALLALGASGFVVGWSVKKGLQAADRD